MANCSLLRSAQKHQHGAVVRKYITLRHYPSTNSCKYTWFLLTGLKNYNKRQIQFINDLKTK